ncbi:bifunctional 2-polyprenyl-6-hydroxyphenol methylase/3-demethylubiquinol 3-O-methyltransferase UbiG [Pelagibius sp. Alg239-R121]|uniref:class I SAM-dependent methyltransferase n=1 Tax=Pelagibius sp. Alg239-R121 TaxID=2993448 RepID=UPI0024A688E5|nr:class I SAM-dependent methyltransferase [Pelagibius sp. Alg239-R121]
MTFKTEAYEQNYQQFRSLNQIMWQIPVLAMTLTGGLWFGVSRLEDDSLLFTVLLLTAVVGNLTLVAILYRFRHVMGCYLKWLKDADSDGFVEASSNTGSENWFERFCNADKTVRNLFSFLLYWAAGWSAIVLIGYWHERNWDWAMTDSTIAIDFYDQHAAALSDSYESIAFEKAYPFLVPVFEGAAIEVLDIGAGTGRDASWIASKGHSVTAVEPSAAMRSIATSLHPSNRISWIDDRLPSLSGSNLITAKFDVVLLNAVWMHVNPSDHKAAIGRVFELTKPGGAAFASLRLGPQRAERGMHEVSSSEFVSLARSAGFTVVPKGDFADLLGRPEVSWKMYELRR